MNRRFPAHIPTSGIVADSLLLLSGLVLMVLALVAIAAGSDGSAARPNETEAPPPVQVQSDELTQMRLSDWLDRALRREALRKKGIV